jgi:multidrug resistance efflux pump
MVLLFSISDTNHRKSSTKSAVFQYQRRIFTMTENEKKLFQAKHRLEQAQARDRVKERKARTRRLIQEGAVLEKAFPEARAMNLDELEDTLCERLRN